ncbi:MAG: response regulator [Cyclobacteriaceae bacterium]
MALERRREKKNKYNILYVDDEAANLRVFKSVFKRDYKVFIAESGMDAINIIKENKIHLLVTDQRMPGMSGVELLEQVVDDHPEMVKMILSGFSDVEDIIKAVNECGLDKYLMKPWNKEDLGATFDKALAKFKSDEDKNEIHIVKKALQDNENYAHKQIRALLPKEEQLNEFFDDSFALYKPVNDLGGVFYWFGTAEEDEKGILVAIDCNEKGVKGALLTMLFETALKEMIYKKKIYDTEEILRNLDKHFRENLPEMEDGSSTVGYNVSVVVIDKKRHYVTFSGAGQNMLYLDANDDIEIAEGGAEQIGKGSDSKQFGSFSGTFDEVKSVYLVGSNTEGQITNTARRTSLSEIIDDIADRSFNEQKEELMISLAESISGSPQQYDVMIVGVKL